MKDKELEDFIVDWYYDKKSYIFAQDLGRYLFQFIDRLYEQGLKTKTVRKHIDNCWAIGFLECGYGYKDVFSPDNVFNSPDARYEHEYKRKFSDSKYALSAYRATWKKLYKYAKVQRHPENE
ncbi:hypothetical protein D1AOALGA4SA_8530 [Olavius algarvensis Delta 1 endosymbiont]|nr:hypothetical protein D1AOALGA4SA_8530 [Olavius algarvensis Delta 1 endosymbiont]